MSNPWADPSDARTWSDGNFTAPETAPSAAKIAADKAAFHAEINLRMKDHEARKAAAFAAFATALPVSPSDTRTVLVFDEETGKEEVMTAGEFLRRNPDARYGVDGFDRAAVKLSPEGMAWTLR